jgi:uncharacterized protein (TIGR04255 family)
MTEPQHLPNAPITEAVLDIRTGVPEPVTLDDLAKFGGRIEKRYPVRQVRHSWAGEVQINPETGPTVKPAKTGPDGYRFDSSDRRQVVQVWRDGFSYSRLKPYQQWESFQAEARDLWQHYVAVAKPEKVTRFALRYINRIHLPLPISDFKDWLLTAPEIAPELPQKLSTFFFRVVISDDERQATAIITQAIEDKSDQVGTIPLIFDIDVFRQGAFPTEPSKLWPLFESLRQLKDEIFFKSITDSTKELFQ